MCAVGGRLGTGPTRDAVVMQGGDKGDDADFEGTGSAKGGGGGAGMGGAPLQHGFLGIKLGDGEAAGQQAVTGWEGEGNKGQQLRRGSGRRWGRQPEGGGDGLQYSSRSRGRAENGRRKTTRTEVKQMAVDAMDELLGLSQREQTANPLPSPHSPLSSHIILLPTTNYPLPSIGVFLLSTLTILLNPSFF